MITTKPTTLNMTTHAFQSRSDNSQTPVYPTPTKWLVRLAPGNNVSRGALWLCTSLKHLQRRR